MTTFKVKTRNWGLQINVMILFLIAIGTLLAAAYIVRENEKILRHTVNQLSEPNRELSLIRNIFPSISEAENNLRFYALTNDKDYYSFYNVLIDSVKAGISRLNETYRSDEFVNQKLDSVVRLLDQRDQLIADYIKIKSQRESFSFAELAFSTLRKGADDSLRTRQRTTTTITTQFDTVIVPPLSADRPEKTEGFFNKLKKVFSKSAEESVKPALPDSVILSTKQVTTDTSEVLPVDSVLRESIEQELVRIRNRENRDYNALIEREVELLKNSSLTIDQIVEIFRRLELSLIIKNEIQAKDARMKASQSLWVIVLLSSIALVMILFLTILIINNIRRSNRYRHQLILSNIQANELAKVKEEFLANMTHEMRTPLNAIIGFSDQLSETRLDNNQDKYLDAVRRSSRHLLEVVNDILDLSKLVAGKLTIEHIPFQLQEVFDDVIPPFRIQALEKKLEFKAMCNIDPELIVEGDPLRLRQILYNLLSNAIKFTHAGKIFINCDLKIVGQNVEAVFSVIDTGIGIQENRLDEIFEDFIQAESSSARTYGGSGLGLGISRRLARLMNGDIKVKSIPDKGSEFTLHIKMPVSSDLPDLHTHDIPHEKLKLKDKRLLVVDDDDFNILLARVISEKNEMLADVVPDGYKALEMLENNIYDIILTDLQMPGLTGSELVAYIRNHSRPEISQLPVIAFTATKFERFDEKLLAQGFNEVLQKPFMEEEFLYRIAYYLTPDIASQQTIYTLSTMSEYNIDQIKLFAGNNNVQLVEILRTFINSAKESSVQFRDCLASGEFSEIKNIAHKLLTSYGHLKVNAALDILNALDQMDISKPDVQKIGSLLDQLEGVNRILFDGLESEMEQLLKTIDI